MAKKKAVKKATSKKKTTKKTASKKKTAKKVAKKATKKVAKKKVAKKKSVAKKVSKKAVTKKTAKKVSKKTSSKVKSAVKKATKKAAKKTVTKSKAQALKKKAVAPTKKSEAKISESKTKKNKRAENVIEHFKGEESIESLVKKQALKRAKANVSAEQEENELSLRKARLIEKYIRQGKAWDDIVKNIENFAVDYTMKEKYEARSVIQHKSLGIGYVMSVVNNRMMVYFEDGYRNLIMNYGS